LEISVSPHNIFFGFLVYSEGWTHTEYQNKR